MSSKLNVFLDLDETIVSANTLSGPEKNRLDDFFYLKFGKDMYIVIRPFTRVFLDYLFKNFNVHVWTAASKEYAEFVVRNVVMVDRDPSELKLLLWDEHVKIAHNLHGGYKDLRLVEGIDSIRMHNTLIIDDNIDVYKSQPNNTILVKQFKYPDTTDDHLIHLMKHLGIVNEIFKRTGVLKLYSTSLPIDQSPNKKLSFL
jgi:TFIIF-interacting CTD phosphatase-like protein